MRANALTRIDQLRASPTLDEGAGPLLDAVRQLLAEDARSAIPYWLTIAQAFGDDASLGQIVESVTALTSVVVPELPETLQAAASQMLVLGIRDALGLQERFAIGAAALVMGQQAALGASDADPNEPGIDAVSASITATISDWAGLGAASVEAANAALVLMFLRDVMSRHSLSNRAWSLLLLRLDRAFAEQAGVTLSHRYSPAIGALIAAIPRFAFLRAALEEGGLFFETQHLPAIELAAVLAATTVRRDDSFTSALYDLVSPTRCGALLGERFDAFSLSRKQCIAALRSTFERFETDPLEDALNYIERVARHGMGEADAQAYIAQRVEQESVRFLQDGLVDSELAVPLLLGTCAEAIAHAAATARDDRAAIEKFRMLAPLIIGTDTNDNFWQHPMLGRALMRIVPVSANAAARPSAIVDALASLAKDCVDYSLEWMSGFGKHLAETYGPQAPAVVIAGLQRLLVAHRFFDAPKARGAWREEISTWIVLTVPLAQVSHISARMREVPALLARYERQPAAHIASALQRGIEAFISNSAALKIATAGPALARHAAEATLAASPDYADKIGASGKASCIRDTSFTLQRLAQSLGGSEASPSDAMLWWWTSTIGTYLVSREQQAMRGHLDALRAGLASILDADEFEVASSVIGLVYQRALSVKGGHSNETRVLHHRLLADSPLAVLRIAADCGQVALHHKQLMALEEATAEGRDASALMDAFLHTVLEVGDAPTAIVQLAAAADLQMRQLAASELISAWLERADTIILGSAKETAPFSSVLLDIGMQALVAVALARHLRACAGQLRGVATAPGAHRGDPAAEPSDVAQLGERDLRLFIFAMADALAGSTAPVAMLNIGRYWLECLLPVNPFPAEAWSAQLVALEAELSAACSPRERGLLHRIFSMLLALAHRSKSLSALGPLLFGREDLVITQSSTEESEWRAVAGGMVIVAACLQHRWQQEVPSMDDVFRASGLDLQDIGPIWSDSGRELAEFMASALDDPRWGTSLASTVEQGSRFFISLQVAQTASGLPPLDIWFFCSPNAKSVQRFWQHDRLALCRTQRLSTPLQQDLLLLKGVGWRGIDMVSIRNAAENLDMAFESIPAMFAGQHSDDSDGSLQQVLWMIQSLAQTTAFDRPLEPFDNILPWIADHFARRPMDGTQVEFRSAFERVFQMLEDQLLTDDGTGMRIVELAQHIDQALCIQSCWRAISIHAANAVGQSGSAQSAEDEFLRALRRIAEWGSYARVTVDAEHVSFPALAGLQAHTADNIAARINELLADELVGVSRHATRALARQALSNT